MNDGVPVLFFPSDQTHRMQWEYASDEAMPSMVRMLGNFISMPFSAMLAAWTGAGRLYKGNDEYDAAIAALEYQLKGATEDRETGVLGQLTMVGGNGDSASQVPIVAEASPIANLSLDFLMGDENGPISHFGGGSRLAAHLSTGAKQLLQRNAALYQAKRLVSLFGGFDFSHIKQVSIAGSAVSIPKLGESLLKQVGLKYANQLNDYNVDVVMRRWVDLYKDQAGMPLSTVIAIWQMLVSQNLASFTNEAIVLLAQNSNIANNNLIVRQDVDQSRLYVKLFLSDRTVFGGYTISQLLVNPKAFASLSAAERSAVTERVGELALIARRIDPSRQSLIDVSFNYLENPPDHAQKIDGWTHDLEAIAQSVAEGRGRAVVSINGLRSIDDFFNLISTTWHEVTHVYQGYLVELFRKQLGDKKALAVDLDAGQALLLGLASEVKDSVAYRNRLTEVFAFLAERNLLSVFSTTDIYSQVQPTLSTISFNQLDTPLTAPAMLEFLTNYLHGKETLSHAVDVILGRDPGVARTFGVGLDGKALAVFFKNMAEMKNPLFTSEAAKQELSRLLNRLTKEPFWYGWEGKATPLQMMQAYQALGVQTPPSITATVYTRDRLLSRMFVDPDMYLYSGRNLNNVKTLVVLLDGITANSDTRFSLALNQANLGRVSFGAPDGSNLVTQKMLDILNDPLAYRTYDAFSAGEGIDASDIWVQKARPGLMSGEDSESSTTAEALAALVGKNEEIAVLVMRKNAQPMRLSDLLSHFSTALRKVSPGIQFSQTVINVCRPNAEIPAVDYDPATAFDPSKSRFYDRQTGRLDKVAQANVRQEIYTSFQTLIRENNAARLSDLNVVPKPEASSPPFVKLGITDDPMLSLRVLAPVASSVEALRSLIDPNRPWALSEELAGLQLAFADAEITGFDLNADGTLEITGRYRATELETSVTINRGSKLHQVLRTLYDISSQAVQAGERIQIVGSSNVDGVGLSMGLFGIVMGIQAVIQLLAQPTGQNDFMRTLALAKAASGIGMGGNGVAQFIHSVSQSAQTISAQAAGFSATESMAAVAEGLRWAGYIGKSLAGIGLGLQAFALGADIVELVNATSSAERKIATTNIAADATYLGVTGLALGLETFASLTSSLVAAEFAGVAGGVVGSLSVPLFGVGFGSTALIVQSINNEAQAERVAVPFGDLKRQYDKDFSGLQIRNGALDLADDLSMVKKRKDGQWEYVHPSEYHIGAVVRTPIQTVDLSNGEITYATGNMMKTSTVLRPSFGTEGEGSAFDFNANDIGMSTLRQNVGPAVDITDALANGLVRRFNASQVSALVLPIAPIASYEFTGQTTYLAFAGPSSKAYGVSVVHNDLERLGIFYDTWQILSGLEVSGLQASYRDTVVDIVLGDQYVQLVTPPKIPSQWQNKITYNITGTGCGYGRLSISEGASYIIRPPAFAREIWMLSGTVGNSPKVITDSDGGLKITIGEALITFRASSDQDAVALPAVYYGTLGTDGNAYTETVYKILPNGVDSIQINSAYELDYASLLIVGEAFNRALVMDSVHHVLYESVWGSSTAIAISNVRQDFVAANGQPLITLENESVWQQTAEDVYLLTGITLGSEVSEAELESEMQRLYAQGLGVAGAEYSIARFLVAKMDQTTGYYDTQHRRFITFGPDAVHSLDGYALIGKIAGNRDSSASVSSKLFLVAVNVDQVAAGLPGLRRKPSTPAEAMAWVAALLSSGLRDPRGNEVNATSLINHMLALNGSWIGSANATYDASNGTLNGMFDGNFVFGPSPSGETVLTAICNTSVRTSAQAAMSLSVYVQDVLTHYSDLHAPVIKLIRTPNASGHAVSGWYDTVHGVCIVPDADAEPEELSYGGYDPVLGMGVLYSAADRSTVMTVRAADGKILDTLDLPFSIVGASVGGGYLNVLTSNGLVYAAALGGNSIAADWTWTGVTEEFVDQYSTPVALEGALRAVLSNLPDGVSLPAAVLLPGNGLFVTDNAKLLLAVKNSVPADAKLLGIQTGAVSEPSAAFWFSQSTGKLYRAVRNSNDPITTFSTVGAYKDARVLGTTLVLTLASGAPVVSGIVPSIRGLDSLMIQGAGDESTVSATFSLQAMQRVLDSYRAVLFAIPCSIALLNSTSQLRVIRDGADIVLRRVTDGRDYVLMNAVDERGAATSSAWKVQLKNATWTVAELLRQTATLAAPGAISLLSPTAVDVDGKLATAQGIPRLRIALRSSAIGDVICVYDDGSELVAKGVLTAADVKAGYVDLMLGTDLAEGMHVLSAKLSREASNSSSFYGPRLEIRVDTTGPETEVSILSNGNMPSSDGAFLSNGKSGDRILGTLTSPLTTGQRLAISFNGGKTWMFSATEGDSPSTANSRVIVSGTNWSVIDIASHRADWMLEACVVDALGNPGAVTSRSVKIVSDNMVSPIPAFASVVSITGAVLVDDDSDGATFVTNSDSRTYPLRRRVVTGQLSRPLHINERIAVSFDGGQTYFYANLAGDELTWRAVDPFTHESDWAILTQVVSTVEITPTLSTPVKIDRVPPTAIARVVAMSHESGLNNWVTSDGSAGRTVSGYLTKALEKGDILQVSFDEGRTWLSSTQSRDRVRIDGTSWAAMDPNAHDSSWTIMARVVDRAGNTGASTTQTVTLSAGSDALQGTVIPSIVLISGDTSKGQFNTCDGAAGHAVFGMLNGLLGQEQKLEVSFDDGKTWLSSDRPMNGVVVSDLNWTAVDQKSHSANWTVKARVVSNGVPGGVVKKTVTFDADIPAAIPVLREPVSVSGNGKAERLVTVELSQECLIGLLSGEKIQVSGDAGVTWRDATLASTRDPNSINSPLSASAILPWDDKADARQILARVVDVAGNCRWTSWQQVTLSALVDRNDFGILSFPVPILTVPINTTTAPTPPWIDAASFVLLAVSEAAMHGKGMREGPKRVKPVMSTNASLTGGQMVTWLYGIYEDGVTKVVMVQFSLSTGAQQVPYRISAWNREGDVVDSLATILVGDEAWVQMPYADTSASAGYGMDEFAVRAWKRGSHEAITLPVTPTKPGPVPLLFPDALDSMSLSAITPSPAKIQFHDIPSFPERTVAPVRSTHPALTNENVSTWLYGTVVFGTTYVIQVQLTSGRLGNEAVDYQVNAWSKQGDVLSSLTTQPVGLDGTWISRAYANSPADPGIRLAEVTFTSSGISGAWIQGRFASGAISRNFNRVDSDTIEFRLSRGDGINVLDESASTIQDDVVTLGKEIHPSQLWFEKSNQGRDLVMRIIGTSDWLTVRDWYQTTSNKIHLFQTAEHMILDRNHVENLVQAMASFAPPSLGQTVLSDDYQRVLEPVIAAQWSDPGRRLQP